MLPLALFRSRTFAGANLLTLLALRRARRRRSSFCRSNLIQVQHYAPTAAGAALLPFILIIFLLSRWSGGLVERVRRENPARSGSVDRRGGLRALPSAGCWRQLLDDFFPGHRCSRSGDGGERRAPHDHGDEFRSGKSGRRRVGNQQRDFANRGTARDRDLRDRDAAEFNQSLARPAFAWHSS